MYPNSKYDFFGRHTRLAAKENELYRGSPAYSREGGLIEILHGPGQPGKAAERILLPRVLGIF